MSSTILLFSFLVGIMFWLSIGVDIGDFIWKKIKSKREMKIYEKYILSLSEEKLDIVRELFNNPPQYNAYLHENDPNVLELAQANVIFKLKNVAYTRWREVKDINDVPFIYILQPPALDIMKAHPDKFKLDK